MEICARVYRPRRARESSLFRLVEQHLEEFLRVYPARFAKAHSPLRSVVEHVVLTMPRLLRGIFRRRRELLIDLSQCSAEALSGVSSSGYYAWQVRPVSHHALDDAALSERIRTIHIRSRGTYGVPRIHFELAAEGTRGGRKRVARLMRAAGLQGISRRKGCLTTTRSDDAASAPDLVNREFVAPGPNELWVADITYIPTWSGFLYLAIVLDAWSRRVVGWAMETHLRTELVLEALDMALWRRRPIEVIHHSDQGCQYTSITFGVRCREAGVKPSMGSIGDCFDNAMCESFFATLECELLDRQRFRTQAEARLAVFDFFEGFYNTHRRHSALGYDSPVSFERRQAEQPVIPSP